MVKFLKRLAAIIPILILALLDRFIWFFAGNDANSLISLRFDLEVWAEK